MDVRRRGFATGGPLGRLVLEARDGELWAVRRVAGGAAAEPGPADPVLRAADRGLRGFFGGTVRGFGKIPLAERGTAFQREVWAAVREVPWGRTVTYGELAARLGRPGAARAVGAALGANPWLVVVPCHRVVGAGGSLTGFAAGVEAKRWLLEREAAAAEAASTLFGDA